MKQASSRWSQARPAPHHRCLAVPSRETRPAFPVGTWSCGRMTSFFFFFSFFPLTRDSDWHPRGDPGGSGTLYVPGAQARHGGGVGITLPPSPPEGLRLGLRTKDTGLRSGARAQGRPPQLGTVSSDFTLARSSDGEGPWVRRVSPGTASGKSVRLAEPGFCLPPRGAALGPGARVAQRHSGPCLVAWGSRPNGAGPPDTFSVH